jgi:hypothetical protein
MATHFPTRPEKHRGSSASRLKPGIDAKSNADAENDSAFI